MFLTAGIAVLSLLVNGTTTGPLVRFLKLDRCVCVCVCVFCAVCVRSLVPENVGVFTCLDFCFEIVGLTSCGDPFACFVCDLALV